MAKKDKTEEGLNKVKLIIGIVVGLIVIVSAILTVNSYFAKTEDVEKVVKAIEEEHKELENEDRIDQVRLDMAITDDHIFQQEQHIQQMKNYRIFESKAQVPELSPIEKEIMDKAEKRLEELRKVKSIKMKNYEEMRKK